MMSRVLKKVEMAHNLSDEIDLRNVLSSSRDFSSQLRWLFQAGSLVS